MTEATKHGSPPSVPRGPVLVVGIIPSLAIALTGLVGALSTALRHEEGSTTWALVAVGLGGLAGVAFELASPPEDPVRRWIYVTARTAFFATIIVSLLWMLLS